MIPNNLPKVNESLGKIVYFYNLRNGRDFFIPALTLKILFEHPLFALPIVWNNFSCDFKELTDKNKFVAPTELIRIPGSFTQHVMYVMYTHNIELFNCKMCTRLNKWTNLILFDLIRCANNWVKISPYVVS